MATTTNYGWTTPDDTALVKDGAAAIRTLGTSVDTTTKNLNPQTTLGDIAYRSSTSNVNTRLGIGTTGQVLTVAGGVPAWGSVDPLLILDAKGDLITATAADTPARLAVGTNGQLLSANSAIATGLEWITPAASGGMTLISTTSLTGATVSLSSIPQTYKNLQLVIRDYTSATNGSSMNMRINGADSSTNYKSVLIRTSSTTTINREENRFIFNDATTDQKNGSNNSAATIDFYDYTQTRNVNFTASYTYMNSSSVTNAVFANAVFKPDSIAAITTITLFFQSADFTGGTALLYGVS
jgi:hypothetical protein